MGAAMGTRYLQLSLSERIEIYHLLASGHSLRFVARQLGRAPSTISREVRRNSKVTKQFEGGYLPDRADQLASRRRQWDARFKMQRQPDLQCYVRDRLAMGWSPQQIAGRLAQENNPMRISHESIYRFIYHRRKQKDYWHHLLPQRKHKRGRLKRGGLGSVAFIKQRKTLDQRPKAAGKRRQYGHWEADLMMFAKYQKGILVLHERVTRVIRLVRLESKHAATVASKIKTIMAPLPSHLRRTLTFDNGSEFADHHTLHKPLGIETFFCDPRAPWQKGGVENAIGRLRRPLPRKSNLANLSPHDLRKLADNYNNTPRKCIGYQTPNEIFNPVALQT